METMWCPGTIARPSTRGSPAEKESAREGGWFGARQAGLVLGPDPRGCMQGAGGVVGQLSGHRPEGLRNSWAEPRMTLQSRSVQRKQPTRVRPSVMRMRMVRLSSASSCRRACAAEAASGSASESCGREEPRLRRSLSDPRPRPRRPPPSGLRPPSGQPPDALEPRRWRRSDAGCSSRSLPAGAGPARRPPPSPPGAPQGPGRRRAKSPAGKPLRRDLASARSSPPPADAKRSREASALTEA